MPTGNPRGVIIESDVGPIDILPHVNNPDVVKKEVPVNVGLFIGTLKCNAVCAAVDIGISEVLSRLVNPTIDWVMPDTVPKHVGLALGS